MKKDGETIMTIKRAALYIRVSTDEQARHGYSLGEQRNDLTEYAERKNYVVVDVYADEGISARKSMRHRQELQRLLRDVEQGKIDVIIIKCLDRWFRNVADFYKVQEILDKYKVEWECTQEDYNTSTTQGRLMLNLKLAIAQNESDLASDRIKYVKEGKRRRKEWNGGSLALGFSVDDNRHLIPNEDIEIVKFLFEYISNGNSKRSAVNLIYEKFGKVVSVQTIGGTLRNKIYIGEYAGIKDFCDPVISKDLFERVQLILDRNYRAPQRNRIYLFRSLIRCPVCGNRLIAHTHPYFNIQGYRCKNKADNILMCTFGGYINEKKLEKWLLENVQGILLDTIINLQSQHKQDGIDYQAKLSAVKTKLSRLNDLYIEGKIDYETHSKKFEELSQEEREYTEILNKADFKISDALKTVMECDNLPEIYECMSQEGKQKFWQSILKEITFTYTFNGKRYTDYDYKLKFLL